MNKQRCNKFEDKPCKNSKCVIAKKNTNIYICCYLNKPLRKNMHKTIPMIFANLTLIMPILCSTCILQPSEDVLT